MRILKAALAGVCLFSLAAALAEPIRLHPKNPHYFLFRGKAVALITSGEHYGAVMNLDFDYHRYLAALQAEKLNYTRLFTGSYRELPGKSFGILRNTLAPAPGRLLSPWASNGDKFDLNAWDPAFFERLRGFLTEAGKRGIVVELTLFSSYYQEMHWEVSAFNAANNFNSTTPINWRKLHTLENGDLLGHQERYTRKLVQEANAFDNVIFEIQNEPWSDRPEPAGVINPYLQPPARDQYPNSIDLADEASLAWQTRVVNWITTEEASLPNKHLIAQNYSNFRFPIRKLLAGVSVVNFHYAYPEAVSWNYGLAKAIAYDETGFLGRDDDTYARQAWSFMLAGGSTFDSLDYSFTPGHEDGSDLQPNGPGGGSPALRRRLRILSEFLQSLSLVDMLPDGRVVKHAAGATAHALSRPGLEYAIYFEGGGPIDVTLNLPAGQYSGEWVNIRTGRTGLSEDFSHAGGTKILRTPAFGNGIALKLTRRIDRK
jgi:hypothetical protein